MSGKLMDYKPSASLDNAHTRASILAQIRKFFSQSGVLEVETPIMSHAGVTDVHLQSVTTSFHERDLPKTGYLHTSPEFAMKRLLASWQTPIYQISKVFRDNELGKKHNIEFTMLEWYRPNGTLDALIKELNELINSLFPVDTMFERMSYRQAFIEYAFIDPFTATLNDLEQVAKHFGIDTDLYRDVESVNVKASQSSNDIYSQDSHPLETNNYGFSLSQVSQSKLSQYEQQLSPKVCKSNAILNYSKYLQTPHQSSKRDQIAHFSGILTLKLDNDSSAEEDDLIETWLDLLYSHLVEPNLGQSVPTVIYDFPASQASLAKVATDQAGDQVAKRFELYIKGYEIANAYDELSDSAEQKRRFIQDNQLRADNNLPQIPLDNKLLSALDDMPESVGIAVGIDRLVMLACETNDIAEVISFTSEAS